MHHSNSSFPIRFKNKGDEEIFDKYYEHVFDKNRILEDWDKVLSEAKNERDLQIFLEKHPFMLPGLYDYHQGPVHDVIVTQFPLGSDFVADFAFLTTNWPTG